MQEEKEVYEVDEEKGVKMLVMEIFGHVGGQGGGEGDGQGDG